ncbi:MAG: hypothetical protein Q9218_007073 [Villophora microphyllina]
MRVPITVWTLALAVLVDAAIQTHPLPNPYPLPHSDLRIDFEKPVFSLVATDANDCLFHALQEIQKYIDQHDGGDHQFPTTATYGPRSVELYIHRDISLRGFTYYDALDVVMGYVTKSRREGYFSRWGNVLVKGHQTIATASFTRSVNSGDNLDHRQKTTRRNLKKSLRLNPIQNPYPLPHTDKVIDFEPAGPALPIKEIEDLVTIVHQKINDHIEKHGDGPLPPVLAENMGHMIFLLVSMTALPLDRRITYSDTLQILAAFAIKNGREGYAQRCGLVLVEDIGTQLGHVTMGSFPWAL